MLIFTYSRHQETLAFIWSKVCDLMNVQYSISFSFLSLEPLNASLCSTEVCLVVGSMSLLDPAAAEDMTKVDESGETLTKFNK